MIDLKEIDAFNNDEFDEKYLEVIYNNKLNMHVYNRIGEKIWHLREWMQFEQKDAITIELSSKFF